MTVQEGVNILLINLGVDCCETIDIPDELTFCLYKNECKDLEPISTTVERRCKSMIWLSVEIPELDKGWYMYDLKDKDLVIANGYVNSL